MDKIVTVEAMGIPIGMALSLATDIPMVIVRKRKYGMPGEIEVSQVTGYSKSQLFMNGIYPGDRVIFVDDVVSTGGTALAVLGALSVAGAVVKDVVIVIERSNGAERLRAEGHSLKTMVRVDVDKDRVCSVEETTKR